MVLQIRRAATAWLGTACRAPTFGPRAATGDNGPFLAGTRVTKPENVVERDNKCYNWTLHTTIWGSSFDASEIGYECIPAPCSDGRRESVTGPARDGKIDGKGHATNNDNPKYREAAGCDDRPPSGAVPSGAQRADA